MALRRAASSLAQRLVGGAGEIESALINSSRLGLEASVPGSLSAESIRHASNQAVKQRIRAIKNIGKITKAMKMVAASKMRNAQVAVNNSRGIVDPFVRLFGDHPGVLPQKDMIVAVSSDKGLCGGLNSTITKYTKAMLTMEPSTSESPRVKNIVVIGDKGRAQLARSESDIITMTVQDTYKVRVTFAQASLLAEEILRAKSDAVRVLYNKFHSAVNFKGTVATILSPELAQRQLTDATGNRLDAYEVEASHERADVLQDLYEFQLAATLYNGMLENNVSEHASRMSSMENSTKSAGEMLNKLTLSYNRKRQATITTELIEIIAGASALMDS